MPRMGWGTARRWNGEKDGQALPHRCDGGSGRVRVHEPRGYELLVNLVRLEKSYVSEHGLA